MSSLKLPIFLSNSAKSDVEDILQYTHDTWGDAQRAEYKEVLNGALATIQENPYIGHGRFDLSPLYRVVTAGKHIFIYKITQNAVYVSRVLHSRMDIPSHM